MKYTQLQQEVAVWKNRFEKYQQVCLDMRRNYLKELQILREALVVPKSRKEANLKAISIKKIANIEVQNQLEVYLFTPTEGLDPEICTTFNEYTARLRDTFGERLQKLADLNMDANKKLALYSSQKQLSDLNSIELVGIAFLKGEDPIILWREFRRNLEENELKEIAETEFEALI